MNRADVLAIDGHKCVYCGGVADEIDHVVPVCRGGEDTLGNLVAACHDCNVNKGTGEPTGKLPDRCSTSHPDYSVRVRTGHGSKPTREAKREQMKRYRAKHGYSLRIYWRERKRVERDAVRTGSTGEL